MIPQKAIFKFNSGALALLCSQCRTIIKTGIDFTEEEIRSILVKNEVPPQFCSENCKHEHEKDNISKRYPHQT